MSLLPWEHPSSRHCNISFAHLSDRAGAAAGASPADRRFCQDPDQLDKLLDARALDVAIGPGDVLHMPAYWFHNVLSLGSPAGSERWHPVGGTARASAPDGRTIQCNAFMGRPGPHKVGQASKDLVEHCMREFSGEV